MRAVVTRVKSASVTIGGEVTGSIPQGFLILLGVTHEDQFTLYGSCKKGRRPDFLAAARPETAIPLYEKFIQLCAAKGFPVQTGRFGADMQVESVNDGPLTLLLDTDTL